MPVIVSGCNAGVEGWPLSAPPLWFDLVQHTL